MIRQLRPSTFFVTFTTCINNSSVFTTTFKKLCDEHVIKNTISNNVDTLNIKDLGRNYPISYVHYYEHRMNSFHKLLKSTKILFDKGKKKIWSPNFKQANYLMTMDYYG
jgi:hypothetical protein